MLRATAWTAAVVLGVLASSLPSRADEPQQLARKANAILLKNCYRCHGQDGEKQGGIGYLLDTARTVEKRKIVPGEPEKSRVYVRTALTPEDPMPPPDVKQRPSREDLAILEAWIKAGAPAYQETTPTVAARPPVTERDVYRAMLGYLESGVEEHARYQRFFTLHHLHNDPTVTETELRLTRAAVAKVLNSLSWRRALVQPKAIDAQQTVLAFDLRELDWDLGDQWGEVLRGGVSRRGTRLGYPYGATHDEYPEDEAFNRDARDVYRLAGTKMPAVRADWFVASATQPPAYHQLLRLPEHAGELEKQLRVNVSANFHRDQLARSGFKESGVSQQNRLVERHESAYGAYWKSYDFKDETGVGSLVNYPLGPGKLIRGNPYAKQAFVHDGGEIIFSLPNGLHGYMLVNGEDKRIDEGPTDVVSDRNQFAGRGPVIVNGLSCMGCHRHGTVKDSVVDRVRDNSGVPPEARDKVRRLYPEPKDMQRLLDADADQYLAALERTAGHYLKVGADAGKDIRNFAEPVTTVAKRYLTRGVRVEDAAAELGLSKDELIGAVKANSLLQERGLKVWVNGESVSRRTWEQRNGLDSLYQEVARELKRGLPRNSD